MTFTSLEFTAIAKMAKTMALADGVIQDQEILITIREFARFGVSSEQVKVLLDNADEMEPVVAIAIISKMTEEEKRYVAAFLGAIIAIDGDINQEELKIWRIVSTFCELPTMSIADAISYMAKL